MVLVNGVYQTRNLTSMIHLESKLFPHMEYKPETMTWAEITEIFGPGAAKSREGVYLLDPACQWSKVAINALSFRDIKDVLYFRMLIS